MLGEIGGGASSGLCKRYSWFRTRIFLHKSLCEKQARHRGAFFGKGTIMKTFIRMLSDDSGASAAEYALILAIVGGVIVLAATTLGTAIAGAMTEAAEEINPA